jgi:hypothetical protein
VQRWTRVLGGSGGEYWAALLCGGDNESWASATKLLYRFGCGMPTFGGEGSAREVFAKVELTCGGSSVK